MKPLPLRAVFAGCARDCSLHLPAVLANIEQTAARFAEAAYVFVENDSKDGTKQLLARWTLGRRNASVICLDGLAGEPARTRRLEVARNCYIEAIRADPGLRLFDLLFVLDLDDMNSSSLDAEALERALSFLTAERERVAVFANQRGIYYDMWALRHREICPGDIWEAVFDHVVAHGVQDDVAFDATFKPRIFELAENADPFEVDSAFGGLGIYKVEAVLENPNPYLGYKLKIVTKGARTNLVRWQRCEHVHFHAGLRLLGGKLFVLPWLVNTETQGAYFPSSAYRAMLF
jgi:hypothetical protein